MDHLTQPILFGLTPVAIGYYILLVSSALIAGKHRCESEMMTNA